MLSEKIRKIAEKLIINEQNRVLFKNLAAEGQSEFQDVLNGKIKVNKFIDEINGIYNVLDSRDPDDRKFAKVYGKAVRQVAILLKKMGKITDKQYEEITGIGDDILYYV